MLNNNSESGIPWEIRLFKSEMFVTLKSSNCIIDFQICHA